MSDLTLGSHLITPRFGYHHHGIYIGNQQVIHFTSTGKVERVSLDDFSDDNGYSIHPFHSKFSRHEIVERATSHLGNDNYNVVFNNCEHFCNWCIHEEHSSQQVRNVTLSSATSALATRSLMTQAPTIAGLTIAEMTAASGTVTAGLTLLSATPVLPTAIVGLGVFKLIQFLSD